MQVKITRALNMSINTTMEKKYTPKPKGTRKKRTDPAKWLSGPTELDRELFYAWHKHRAQARFRKEDYELTYEDWRTLWLPDHFHNRGRSPENVILTRKDPSESWSLDNCEVVNRGEYLKVKAREQLHGGQGRWAR